MMGPDREPSQVVISAVRANPTLWDVAWEWDIVILNSEGITCLPVGRDSRLAQLRRLLPVFGIACAVLAVAFLCIPEEHSYWLMFLAAPVAGPLGHLATTKVSRHVRAQETVAREKGVGAVVSLDGRWSWSWSDIAQVEVAEAGTCVFRVRRADGSAYSAQSVGLTNDRGARIHSIKGKIRAVLNEYAPNLVDSVAGPPVTAG